MRYPTSNRLIALTLAVLLGVVGGVAAQVSRSPQAAAATAQCTVNRIWAVVAGSRQPNVLEFYAGSPPNGDGTVTGRGVTVPVSGSRTGNYNTDVALSPDGSTMWGLNAVGDLVAIDVATNTIMRYVNVSYPFSVWASPEAANSLSFTLDGSLIIAGSDVTSGASAEDSSVFVIPASFFSSQPSATSVAAQVFLNNATAVAPGGWSGDFVTLADGSIVGFANVSQSVTSVTQAVYFKKTATGYDPPVVVGTPQYGGSGITIYGATYAAGHIYLAGYDGNWYRMESLPLPGAGNVQTTLVGLDNGAFNGATGIQESYAACSSPDINLTKTATGITGPDAAGVYTSKYTLNIKNGNATLAGSYGPIIDNVSFDPNLQIVGATWSDTSTPSTGNPSGNATGAGPYSITKSNTNIAANTTHTYTISVTFKIPTGTTPTACNGPGTGSYNSISLPPGDETNPNDNGACNTVPNPAPVKPVITLAKSGSLTPTSNNVVGDKVTYTFTITNTGTIPVTNLTITDTKLGLTNAPINATTCSSTTPTPWTATSSLAVGASLTCVAASQYALTQADLNAGKTSNIAYANGQSASGTKADEVSKAADVTVTPKKSLTLAKTKDGTTDTNGNGIVDAGDKLFYLFTLTNDGTVTLKNPTITDAKLFGNSTPLAVNSTNCSPLTPAGFNPATGLAPAAVLTCRIAVPYTINTTTDVTSGKVFNSATAAATAVNDNSTVNSNTATETVLLATPANLTLTKTPGTVGALDPATGLYTVSYSVTLTNSGQTPASYTVTDTPRFATGLNITQAAWTGTSSGSATGAGPYTLGSGTIGATGSATATLTWTVTVTFGYQAGAAQASNCQSGTPNAGLYNTVTVGSQTANACLNPPAPPTSALTLLKQAGAVVDANGDSKHSAGDTITYTFVVKNTGTVTLTGIKVDDAKVGTITCPVTTLAPGASTTCTAAPYVITQGGIDAGFVKNTASASGTPPAGVSPPLSPSSDTNTPLTPQDKLTLQKNRVKIVDSNNNGLTDAGDVLYFSFTVTNEGTSTLSTIKVVDTSLGVNVTASGSLAPKASMTIDKDGANNPFTHTLTVADMNAGSYVNTAEATATGPGPEDPKGSSTVTTTPSSKPSSLSLTKDALPVGTAKSITDVNGNGRTDVNDTITYRFTITNTSLVSLKLISLTDSKLGLTNYVCGAADLAPSASTSCEVTYALKLADINAGSVPNTATVNGQDVNNNPVSATASETVPIVQTASIKVEKKAGAIIDATGNGVSAGDTIEYTIDVTNNGATTLTSVVVNDPKFSTADIPVAGSMDPGAVRTIKRVYTLTQADVDDPTHLLSNTATATGTPPPGVTPPTDTSTVTTPFVAKNAVTLDKLSLGITDVNKNGRVDAGDTIKYSFVVTNVGNTTITSLSLTDPKLNIKPANPLTVTGINLLPTQQYTFTQEPVYILTQQDIDAGSFLNTATATGTGPAGTTPPVSDDEVSFYDNFATLNLAKSASALSDTNADGKVGVGDDVTYTFTVTNTSALTLTPVTLSDSVLGYNKVALDSTKCSTLTLNNAAVASIVKLLPGDVAVCVAATRHRLDQTDVDAGFVTNTATVYGADPKGNEGSSTATSTVNPPRTVGITVVKSNGGVLDTNNNGVKDAGDHVAYTFLITNTSNVTLAPVFVTDTKLGLTNKQVAASLVPGASTSWTAPDYVLTSDDVSTGSVVNNVTATGTPPAGLTAPTAPGTNTVTIAPDPRLTLTKQAAVVDTNSNGFADRAETINYTFLVKNSGNTPLTSVSVSDPMLTAQNVAISCAASTLAAGAQMYCTASMVLRQALLDTGFASGYLKNTATASGTPPSGPAISSTPATAQVPVKIEAKLKLEKVARPMDYNANGFIDAGDWILYSFVLTNTGTTTLTNLSVSDPHLATQTAPDPVLTVTCPTDPLLPGQSATCQASGPYVITAAEGLAKQAENTASATAKDPAGGTVDGGTAKATVLLSGMSLVKSAKINETDGNAKANPGETITYSFTLTNTGGTQLTTPIVHDETLGVTIFVDTNNCVLTPTTFNPTVGLAPGASVGCEMRTPIAITQAQVNAGVPIPNTAVSMAFDANGNLVTSNESPVSVPVDTARSLTIAKTAVPVDTNTSGRLDAGDKITYTFTVKNTGAVTLHDIVVNDPKLAGLNLAVTCTVNTLDAGASTTCTSAEYTITADDVTNKKVDNVATATGTPPSGPAVTSAPSPASVPLAGLLLQKTASLADLNTNQKADAGEKITYRFKLSNTGGAQLTNLTVNDSKFTPSTVVVNSTNCVLTPATFDPAVGLAPGADVECELRSAYSVTADDVAKAAPIVNSATASGTDTNGGKIPSNPSGTSTPVNALPALTLVKSFTVNNKDANPAPSLGDQVSYSFAVTNSGNTNVSLLSIVDGLLANAKVAISCPVASLAPGGTTTCTSGFYTITAADVAAGSVPNSATATGKDPSGTVVTSPPSTAAVDIPGLKLTKSASLQDTDGNWKAKPGEKIRYTFVLENTGGSTLKNLTLTDTKLSLSAIAINSTNCQLTPTTFDPAVGLAPHSSVTCVLISQYTVQQADVDGRVEIYNVATAAATDPAGISVVSPESDTRTPVDSTAKVSVVKSVKGVTDVDGKGYRNAGDRVAYNFVVTNTGSVSLKSIQLDDPLVKSGYTCPELPTPGNPRTLAAGASITCTSDVYLLTTDDVAAGSLSNTVKATGVAPNGSTTPLSDPSTVVLALPGLTLTKVANVTSAKAGDFLSYTFTVKNTGTTRLADPALTDDKLGLASAPINATTCATLIPPTFTPAAGLAPGESVTCVPAATYQVKQADVDAKQPVTNTATASARDVDNGGTVPSGPATATVALPAVGKLAVTKVATVVDTNGDGQLQAGEFLTYTFVVKNTGQLTLSDVSITDPMLTRANVSITCPPGQLAPGADLTCTATNYTVTAADVTARKIDNTATASGHDISSTPVTVTSPPSSTSTPITPLTLTKTATLNDRDADGKGDIDETITYTFVLGNVGTDPLLRPTLTDPLLGASAVAVNSTTCATLTPSTFDPNVGIAPGASISCTWKQPYILTAADVVASVDKVNSAVAGAELPSGKKVPSLQADARVPVDSTPRLALVKTAALQDVDGNKVASVHEDIIFSFSVTNTGEVPVSELRVDDVMLKAAGVSITCPVTLLERGASTTCVSARYKVTYMDVQNIYIRNVATAAGFGPKAQPTDPDREVMSNPSRVELPTTKRSRDREGGLEPGDPRTNPPLTINPEAPQRRRLADTGGPWWAKLLALLVKN